MTRPLLSVVVGFKDYGLDRLAVAIRSHKTSTLRDRIEVVVSDYCSEAPGEVRAIAEAEGARVVATTGDPSWSRSRALNAGLVDVRADYALTTDADILFSPTTHEVILEALVANPASVQLLQCKDLSERFGVDDCADFDWRAFELNSRFRPRWGMGGMAAFHVGAFDAIHGFDERMILYGGEDIDFVTRLRRSGLLANWIDDPKARIYHIWHEPVREAARADPEVQEAIKRNKEILVEDRTVVRNLSGWGQRPPARPVASVVIVTRNRSRLLLDALDSARGQTVRDIEIIVVDDGSDDDTAAVVSRIQDSRLRYFRKEASGIAASRNAGVCLVRSPHTVIADDDDIMLPDRVEAHLNALREGVDGTYGGWIDFDDQTGEMTPNQGRSVDFATLVAMGKCIVHGGSMVKTETLRRFKYNEFMSTGSDYNLMLRMMKSGVRFNHTRTFAILRRFHTSNVTVTDPTVQKSNARRTTGLYLSALSASGENALRSRGRAAKTIGIDGCHEVDRRFTKFLPSRLRHKLVVVGPTGTDQIGGVVAALAHLNVDFEAVVVKGVVNPRCVLISKNSVSDQIFERLCEQLNEPGTRIRFVKSPPDDVTAFVEQHGEVEDSGSSSTLPAVPGLQMEAEQYRLLFGPLSGVSAAIELREKLLAGERWSVLKLFVPISSPRDYFVVTGVFRSVPPHEEALATYQRKYSCTARVVTADDLDNEERA